MRAAALAVALLGLQLAAAVLVVEDLMPTPRQFLEDNNATFSIFWTAAQRVPDFFDTLEELGNATWIAPLDVGFVAVSNRTEEDMLAEIEGASEAAVRTWLGQWIVPQRYATPDALLAAKSARSLSGLLLLFRLTPSRTGVLVLAEDDSLGGGGLLVAPILMGQVATYVMKPQS